MADCGASRHDTKHDSLGGAEEVDVLEGIHGCFSLGRAQDKGTKSSFIAPASVKQQSQLLDIPHHLSAPCRTPSGCLCRHIQTLATAGTSEVGC